MSIIIKKACQQPGIDGIGFIALVNDFTVMGELTQIDEVDLEAACQSQFDPASVVVRGGFDGNPYRPLKALEVVSDGFCLVGDRLVFVGLPDMDGTFDFSGIDTEGDFFYAFCHNNLRNCMLSMVVKPGSHLRKLVINWLW